MADFAFLNGEKGGHVSISGVSGVATKTSYALFLLYMLFETEQGRRLLGERTRRTPARWCSTSRARTCCRSTGRTAASRSDGERARWLARARRRRAGRVPPRAALRAALGAQPRGVARDRRRVALEGRGGDLRLAARRLHPPGAPALLLRRGGGRQDPGRLRRAAGARAARALGLSARERAGRRRARPAARRRLVRVRARRHRAARRRARRRRARGARLRRPGRLPHRAARPRRASEPADQAWTAGAAQGTLLAFLRRLYAQVPRLGKLVAARRQAGRARRVGHRGRHPLAARLRAALRRRRAAQSHLRREAGTGPRAAALHRARRAQQVRAAPGLEARSRTCWSTSRRAAGASGCC